MDRVLVWVAAGLVLGILAASAGLWALFLLLAVGLGALFLALRLRNPYRRHMACLLLLLPAGYALLLPRMNAVKEDPLAVFSRQHGDPKLVLEGAVLEAPLLLPGSTYLTFVLDVDRIRYEEQILPVHGRVLVRWTNPARPIFSHQRVRVQGRLGHRLGPVNNDLAGIEDSYRRRCVHSDLRLRENAVDILQSPPFSLFYWASRLRASEAAILQRVAPEQALPFIFTIWLGERGLISPDKNEQYIDAGIAHILSVSGVHVGMVYFSAQFILLGLVRDRRRRALIVLLLVCAFAFAAGARVATLRSVIMVALYIGAEFVRREPDPLTALGLSSILLLVFNPYSLWDGAFLLSFSSVASMLLFTPLIERRLEHWPRFLRNAIAPSAAVQLLPFPISIHFFHVLPLLGMLANFIVIPAAAVLLWLIFLTVAIGALASAPALLFGHAAAAVVSFIDAVAAAAAAVPGAHPTLTSPAILASALWSLFIFLLFLLLRQDRLNKRLLFGACATFPLIVLCWKPWAPHARIDFLDVGHGDSAFIQTPAGGALLIDAGDASEYTDLGAQVVVPFLLANGIGHLDALAITHPDRDHIGGAREVLRKIAVDQVLLGPPSESPLEQALLEQCSRLGVPVRRPVRGDHIQLEGATLEVLHPPAGWRPDLKENEHSLVVRVRWPGMSALLTGDIEREAESLLATTECRAEILKVPHHGSDTSSTRPFIQAVSPRIAVVSVVPRANFHTASPAVQQRYVEEGARVFRTDLYGGIRARVGAQGIEVLSARRTRDWYVPHVP